MDRIPLDHNLGRFFLSVHKRHVPNSVAHDHGHRATHANSIHHHNPRRNGRCFSYGPQAADKDSSLE